MQVIRIKSNALLFVFLTVNLARLLLVIKAFIFYENCNFIVEWKSITGL